MSAAFVCRKGPENIEIIVVSTSEKNVFYTGQTKTQEGLYCRTIIETNRELLINDARTDEIWNKNLEVNSGMLSYFGIPLNFPDGKVFGTICVLDKKENRFNNVHKNLLAQFKKVLELDIELFLSANAEVGKLIEIIDKQKDSLLKKNDNLRQINQELLSTIENVEDIENKYQDLYENSPTVFISIEPKSVKIIGCNTTAVKVLGYSKDELINRDVFELYTPESTEYAQKIMFPKYLEYGSLQNEEIRVVKKNGEIIDVLLNVNSVLDKNGDILYSRSEWREITELKTAEKELHKAKEAAEENELKYKILLENSSIGVVTIDANENFYFN